VVIRYDSLKFADNKIVLPDGTKDGLRCCLRSNTLRSDCPRCSWLLATV